MFNLSHQSAELSRLRHGMLHCVALGVVVLTGGMAQASIVRPELPEFKFEETAGDCSSSAPSDSSPEAPAEDILEALVIQHALGGFGNSSSSSSTTSSSTSNVALNSLTGSSLADLAVTGWVSSELRFFLPTPPGNDLLRPPQAV
ncbi:hypothetical protein Pr1d_33210 [Bythopirellula goksoeyrii]|uniref:Uncharacterized protein n=1 Tax=Bythopirellula goksoeyrii TaxID=1400387 RepID=A0A5B9QET3_9BACT|nr:hypothetical protein Pr1d_33210 [Bythopirellula goksoeyrii]